MAMSPHPVKDLDQLNPESVQALQREAKHPVPPMTGFNPLIYGNDVDSVDVATRVAMVIIYMYIFYFYYNVSCALCIEDH